MSAKARREEASHIRGQMRTSFVLALPCLARVLCQVIPFWEVLSLLSVWLCTMVSFSQRNTDVWARHEILILAQECIACWAACAFRQLQSLSVHLKGSSLGPSAFPHLAGHSWSYIYAWNRINLGTNYLMRTLTHLLHLLSSSVPGSTSAKHFFSQFDSEQNQFLKYFESWKPPGWWFLITDAQDNTILIWKRQ